MNLNLTQFIGKQALLDELETSVAGNQFSTVRQLADQLADIDPKVKTIVDNQINDFQSKLIDVQARIQVSCINYHLNIFQLFTIRLI